MLNNGGGVFPKIRGEEEGKRKGLLPPPVVCVSLFSREETSFPVACLLARSRNLAPHFHSFLLLFFLFQRRTAELSMQEQRNGCTSESEWSSSERRGEARYPRGYRKSRRNLADRFIRRGNKGCDEPTNQPTRPDPLSRKLRTIGPL